MEQKNTGTWYLIQQDFDEPGWCLPCGHAVSEYARVVCALSDGLFLTECRICNEDKEPIERLQVLHA